MHEMIPKPAKVRPAFELKERNPKPLPPIELQIADAEKELDTIQAIHDKDDFREIIKTETSYGDGMYIILKKQKASIETLRQQVRTHSEIVVNTQEFIPRSGRFGETEYWWHIRETGTENVWEIIINAYDEPKGNATITKGTYNHCISFLQGYTFNLPEDRKSVISGKPAVDGDSNDKTS